jgi:hypothetical protein
MRKYGETKTTRIMIASVPYVTSGSGQKISGRWIFVRGSVHIHRREKKNAKFWIQPLFWTVTLTNLDVAMRSD